MPKIVLYQTDIAQNLGTIVRTAVAFGLPIHVIEPLGFVWNEPKMRRAGMDYLARANITRHKSWELFLQSEFPQKLEINRETAVNAGANTDAVIGGGTGKSPTEKTTKRLVLITTKGSQSLDKFVPQREDYYLFGRETAGVPDEVHQLGDARIVIPMVAGERSINIAQSCAIVMFDSLSKLNLLP